MAKKYANDSCQIIDRSTASYLNNEVKDYAKYVIETRAMPNIMDGLRIGARKIIWAALTGDLSKKKKAKMPALVGDTLKLHYNHGDASLLNTIVQLSSEHVLKYCPFEVIGQIPSLRVTKCDTAPRYLTIKKREYIELFTPDMELLDQKIEEGDKTEPKFFLPIIPMVLLFRTNSPGFGFSFRAFSYSIDSVIDNCVMSITQGSCENPDNTILLEPTIKEIDRENLIYNANKDCWYNVGKYEMNYQTDTVFISDLPYNISFEKYEEHLQNLTERNYIVSYKDLSVDGNIRYIIQFSKGRLKILSQDSWKFFKNLKLFSKIPKDTLNVIDEDEKTMLFFDSPYKLIDVFVKKRLVYYQKRKTRTIRILKEKISKAENNIKFIELVISDQLIINKRKISDIKLDLDKHLINHDVLKLNIGKLTQDEIDEMRKEIQELKDQLHYIISTTIEEMYVMELVNLKSKISEIQKKVV